MNTLHTNEQNIDKIRGLIYAVQMLDLSSPILQANIDNINTLLPQASDALDALELSLSGLPSLQK